ncbi:hypothetical protein AQJ43_10230 [Streptomyces avermitilis]|nr:hypothetical protein AQJ43_10230 [Streptomyces avermitilis]OOV26601.1 hypothetical protein SM007_22340 [Streptomyces avermitilis]GDY78974.1 hypothetical protein SAV31267_084590 [Streptomyces avermitilis]
MAHRDGHEPSFTPWRRTGVTGLLEDDSGRVTGVRYVDEHGSPGELAADLTVACDGRDSSVRRAAGLEPSYFEVPMDVWQVRVPARDPLKEGRVSLTVRDGQFAATLDRGDYYQTSYLIKKGTDGALRPMASSGSATGSASCSAGTVRRRTPSAPGTT